MVLTISQIENLTREELIEELLHLSEISCQLKALNGIFDIFPAKHQELKFGFVDNKELQYFSTPMNYPVRKKCSQQHPVSPQGISRSSPGAL